MLRGDNGLLLVLFVLRGDDGPVRGRLLLLWMDIGCFIFMGLLATEKKKDDKLKHVVFIVVNYGHGK